MRISQRIVLGLAIFTTFLIALIVYFHVGLNRIDRAAVKLQGEWAELQPALRIDSKAVVISTHLIVGFQMRFV